jgi:hypothetical protein
MACKTLVVALSLIAAASPAAAEQAAPPLEGAPEASSDSKYCLRMEPITGTRIGGIRCETREEWARLELDIDKEWPREGVKIIGPNESAM